MLIPKTKVRFCWVFRVSSNNDHNSLGINSIRCEFSIEIFHSVLFVKSYDCFGLIPIPVVPSYYRTEENVEQVSRLMFLVIIWDNTVFIYCNNKIMTSIKK